MINLIALAIPFFLVLIVCEALYAHYRHRELYNLKDTLNNFSSGMVEQVTSNLGKAWLIAAYFYTYQHYRVMSLDSYSPWVILGVIFAVDFIYYWVHRCLHRCNLLWAGHSVHHQSERYNLSVALRQGVLQAWFSWPFYLPLAIVGVSPWLFLIVSASNTLYQFWIHTQVIKTMGFLEYFLNTPSHHRVHHGKNSQYIDKNYAGMFIIWDKLFRTFEPESKPVDYGVTEPLESWNPIYANIKVLKDTIARLDQLPKRLWLSAFVKPPEWLGKHTVNPKPLKPINQNRLNTKEVLLAFALFDIALFAFIYLVSHPNSAYSTQMAVAGLSLVFLVILGRGFDAVR